MENWFDCFARPAISTSSLHILHYNKINANLQSCLVSPRKSIRFMKCFLLKAEKIAGLLRISWSYILHGLCSNWWVTCDPNTFIFSPTLLSLHHSLLFRSRKQRGFWYRAEKFSYSKWRLLAWQFYVKKILAEKDWFFFLTADQYSFLQLTWFSTKHFWMKQTDLNESQGIYCRILRSDSWKKMVK